VGCLYIKEFETRKEAAGLERHIKRIGVNVFLKSEGMILFLLRVFIALHREIRVPPRAPFLMGSI